MANPFKPLQTWARNGLQTLKAMEDAMDYRYEDYAEVRFSTLEKRVALLEQRVALPGRKPA